jgi:hypothetical protein
VVAVDLGEVLPLRRQVLFREDGLDGACVDAEGAVDAVVRVDEQLRVGVAAVDLPQGDSPVRATDAEIAEQYAAMPFGKERTEFLKKNRAAIFSASK